MPNKSKSVCLRLQTHSAESNDRDTSSRQSLPPPRRRTRPLINDCRLPSGSHAPKTLRQSLASGFMIPGCLPSPYWVEAAIPGFVPISFHSYFKHLKLSGICFFITLKCVVDCTPANFITFGDRVYRNIRVVHESVNFLHCLGI
jgi:hypothetical protein